MEGIHQRMAVAESQAPRGNGTVQAFLLWDEEICSQQLNGLSLTGDRQTCEVQVPLFDNSIAFDDGGMIQ